MAAAMVVVAAAFGWGASQILRTLIADGGSSDRTATAGPAQSGAPYGCRGAIELGHAPVSADPCIRVVDGNLELTSHVTALRAGRVTVFVWLTDGNTYRPPVPPHRCVYDFTAGQSATCSILARPDRPGTHWVTATEAEKGRADYPSAWNSFPRVAGTQSSHAVTWPLQK
jgi:hypothetical protein